MNQTNELFFDTDERRWTAILRQGRSNHSTGPVAYSAMVYSGGLRAPNDKGRMWDLGSALTTLGVSGDHLFAAFRRARNANLVSLTHDEITGAREQNPVIHCTLEDDVPSELEGEHPPVQLRARANYVLSKKSGKGNPVNIVQCTASGVVKRVPFGRPQGQCPFGSQRTFDFHVTEGEEAIFVASSCEGGDGPRPGRIELLTLEGGEYKSVWAEEMADTLGGGSFHVDDWVVYWAANGSRGSVLRVADFRPYRSGLRLATPPVRSIELGPNITPTPWVGRIAGNHGHVCWVGRDNPKSDVDSSLECMPKQCGQLDRRTLLHVFPDGSRQPVEPADGYDPGSVRVEGLKVRGQSLLFWVSDLSVADAGSDKWRFPPVSTIGLPYHQVYDLYAADLPYSAGPGFNN